jgi:hypothetical protein
MYKKLDTDEFVYNNDFPDTCTINVLNEMEFNKYSAIIFENGILACIEEVYSDNVTRIKQQAARIFEVVPEIESIEQTENEFEDK